MLVPAAACWAAITSARVRGEQEGVGRPGYGGGDLGDAQVVDHARPPHVDGEMRLLALAMQQILTTGLTRRSIA